MIRACMAFQFVGGETAEDVVPLLEELRAQNKGAIFAYSVEVDESATKGGKAQTPQYRKNVEEMLHSIDVAADFEDKHSMSSRAALGRKTFVALKLVSESVGNIEYSVGLPVMSIDRARPIIRDLDPLL